jgi:hypothetical protein
MTESDASAFQSITLFAGEHAIEAETFSVAFAEPLTHADYRRLEKEEAAIRLLFGSIMPLNSYQFNPKSGIVEVPKDLSGREMLDFDRDGSPRWSAGFQENLVRLTIHKYTRWQDIWPEAEKRLRLLLSCVDSQKRVVAIDFGVVDTLISERARLELLPRIVLNRASAFVSERIYACEDPRWDIQQGWMDDRNDGSLKLTRVDVQASIQNDRSRASVQNILSFRPDKQTITLEDVLAQGDAGSLVNKVYNEFHDENKQLLKKLLHPEILKRLGL